MFDDIKSAKEIVNFIRDEANKRQIKYLIVGVTGGLDSTVLVGLCKLTEIPVKLYYIAINEYGCQTPSKIDSNILALEAWCDETVQVCILHREFNRICSMIDDGQLRDKTISELKRRFVMLTLHTYADHYKGLVVSSINYDEFALGLFAKYCMGDILPFKHIRRREIREIAKQLNVSDSIINKQAIYEKSIPTLDGRVPLTNKVHDQMLSSKSKQIESPSL